MEITIKLSEVTKKILLKRLKIKDLREVFSLKYSNTETPVDINKEKARMYNKRVRGSVRLKTGRYYSQAEYEERIKRVKDLELP